MIVMSPFQQYLTQSKAHEVFWGSARGASKSYGAIGLFVGRAFKRKNYQAVIFRKRFKDFRTTVFPIIDAWINEICRVDGKLVDKSFKFVKSQDPRLENEATGSVITISAAETEDDTDKIQGASIHNLLVDEAQTILPAVLQKIAAVVRGEESGYLRQMYYLANPNGPGHAWLKKRFVEPARGIAKHGNVEHPDWKHPVCGDVFPIRDHWKFSEEVEVDGEMIKKNMEVFLSKTWMNPVYNYREYIATLKLSLKDNHTLAQQWIENDWDAVAGEFFPNLSDAIADGDINVEGTDRVLCSIDQGQRKTAVVWAAVSQDGVYKIFNERMYHSIDIPPKVEMIKMAYPLVELYILDPAGRAKLEGSGVKTQLKLYQQAGLRNSVYCKSNDRKAGWEALRTGFADGTIKIDPSCKGLIGSLSSLVTKENDAEDCEKDDGSEMNNDGDHFADALRYLYVNGFYKGKTDEYYEREKAFKEDPVFARHIYGYKERVR